MVKFLIKLAISLSLIGYIIAKLNWGELKQNFLNISYYEIITFVFIYTIAQSLSVFKWFLIAKGLGIETTYFKAWRSYFSGMFINIFGLGMVGGDISRALFLSRTKATAAISSVICDRIQGLAVLSIIGLIFLQLTPVYSNHIELIALSLIIIPVISIFIWLSGPKLQHIFSRFGVDAVIFPRSLKLITHITVISATFHCIQILLHWHMINALDAKVPLLYLFAAIPCVNILTSIPISWQGLGVREVAYIHFLSPKFLDPSECAALGALWLFSMTVSSCLGGISFLIDKGKK